MFQARLPRIASQKFAIVTLLAPEEFVNIFSCLPGSFALKNGGDFW